MAHFALCSRADMAPAAPAGFDAAWRPHQQRHTSGDQMTWQQQEDFGTKNVSKIPLQQLLPVPSPTPHRLLCLHLILGPSTPLRFLPPLVESSVITSSL